MWWSFVCTASAGSYIFLPQSGHTTRLSQTRNPWPSRLFSHFAHIKQSACHCRPSNATYFVAWPSPANKQTHHDVIQNETARQSLDFSFPSSYTTHTIWSIIDHNVLRISGNSKCAYFTVEHNSKKYPVPCQHHQLTLLYSLGNKLWFGVKTHFNQFCRGEPTSQNILATNKAKTLPLFWTQRLIFN